MKKLKFKKKIKYLVPKKLYDYKLDNNSINLITDFIFAQSSSTTNNEI